MFSYNNWVRRIVADQISAGMVSAFLAERKIEAQQTCCAPPETIRWYIPQDLLTRQNDAALARMRTLEEKARGNLFAVTLCSSIIFSGLALVTNHDAAKAIQDFHAARPLLLLLNIPLAYFAGSAFAAVKVLQVGRVYRLSLAEENSEEEAKRLSEWYLGLNQLTGTIKANWAWVSFTCLRNAILSLFLFAAIGEFLFVR